MRVLVTGAAGFIGSNLVLELLAQGHEVIALDNLSQGSMLNLAGASDHNRFSFVDYDIRNRAEVREAADGCDAIFHLAAYKIPRYTDAYDTLMINGMGSEVVAQVAGEIGARVIAASTSDVYGKNPDVPFKETMDSVIGPPEVKRWAYAISKMFEEQLLFACHERFGIEVAMVRFFGGYGPHQSLTWWGGPQSVFIEQALDGEVIPIHGDGSQTRSFTYVSDHVSGLIGLLDADISCVAVNLGSTEEISIADLARLIWRLVRGDEEPLLEFVPYETFGRYEDVMRRLPDVSRARELCGFEAKVGLEEGLKRTIEWQVERRALGTLDETS